MPQLVMEYSANIIEKHQITNTLNRINQFLTKTLPTELASCKSRAIEHTTYSIGDANPKNAFIHIDLRVLSGRTTSKLNEVGSGIIQLLKEQFNQSCEQLNLKFSVEISELQSTYFKT